MITAPRFQFFVRHHSSLSLSQCVKFIARRPPFLLAIGPRAALQPHAFPARIRRRVALDSTLCLAVSAAAWRPDVESGSGGAGGLASCRGVARHG